MNTLQGGRMDNLHERLRELRKKLYLSQGNFAERMGVKQSTWSNIEAGNNPCSDRYIRLVCLTFNVREEWLRTGQGEVLESTLKPPPQPVLGNDGKPLHPETVELITICQELIQLNREAVITFAETTLQAQRNTIKAMEDASETRGDTQKGENSA
jgi:transcriptional regulator with XRE-family HTH domain